MSRKFFSRHDQPLSSDDLRTCHLVLDATCRDFAIEPGSEEPDRIAAITIELYQQGVHDIGQLPQLVDAARGFKLDRDAPGATACLADCVRRGWQFP